MLSIQKLVGVTKKQLTQFIFEQWQHEVRGRRYI